MRNRIQLKGSNRDFNRELMTLVIPIALQNLISATVISVDVVMLGMISQSAMSAVSLAGQITFALTLFYMGMSAGQVSSLRNTGGKRILQPYSAFLVSLACSPFVSPFCFFYLPSFFRVHLCVYSPMMQN